MITFKQYLAEEKQDLVKFLRENCGQAVYDMFQAESYLWRGAKKKGTELFSFGEDTFEGYFGHPREDRVPRDTPRWAHDAINDYFKSEFNEPLRSNSLFCYSQRNKAGGYGSIYAIIPMGNYKIFWSPVIDDLTTTLFPDAAGDDFEHAFVGGEVYWSVDKRMDLKDVTQEMQVRYIHSTLDNAGYKQGSAFDALKSGSELMVRCQSYLALSISESELTEVIQDAVTDEKVEQ